jgi:TolB-like protein
MSSEGKQDGQLEIAHVLFIDIVGYSKLPINRQSELLQQLNQIVRATEQFRRAEAANKLVRLPTGDGMALAFFTSPDAPVKCGIPDKSIAVLPLENLSEEKENAFFADGVQDELLSNLAKIKDLKVISRTSVMQYKTGITRNLKDIAQQLGVSNVVEGSVRRSGNHMRVSVQLIDALTDRHIWSENYDCTLADSITLQGELATEIAAAVGATLSPQEKARVEATPTKNTAAMMPTCAGALLRPGGQPTSPMLRALRGHIKRL